jgi:hypothetical protein
MQWLEEMRMGGRRSVWQEASLVRTLLGRAIAARPQLEMKNGRMDVGQLGRRLLVEDDLDAERPSPFVQHPSKPE